MPTITKEDTSWHLDKRVPVSLIAALCLQTGAFLWFISKMDSRIEMLERAQVVQRDRDQQQDNAARDTLSSLRGDILEVNRKLDRLIERSIK